MKKNRFRENAKTLIPDLIVFAIMVTSVTYALLSFLELKPSAIEIFFTVAILTVISYLIYSKLYGFFVFLGVLLFYVAGVALRLNGFFREHFYFYRWFIETFTKGTIYDFAREREAFIFFVLFTFTLIYYLFVIKLRFFIVYTIFTISVFAYWSLAEFSLAAKRVTVNSFFVVLFTFLYFYAANRYRLITVNNEFVQNKISYAKWQKFVIPLISIVLILSFFIMPANINMDLKNESIYNFLEDMRLNVESIFTRSKTGLTDKFNLAFVGFSHDQSKLGGPVRLSINHVFDVEARGQVYLRGAVFDNYTGSGWTCNIDERGFTYQSSSDTKFREIFYFDDMDKFRNYNIFKIDRVYIDNIDIHTTSIFTTNYPVNFSLADNNAFFNERSEMFSNKSIRGNNYEFDYYDVSLLPQVINFIRMDVHNFKEANSSNYSDSRVLSKMKYIQEKYLQLPQNLPDSVRQLAHDITGYSYSQIDKVMAIQNYLTTNYRYVLNPSIVPDGVDFTEHFLFDTKEGYCTYYATAMTVLCRSAGIPARYVTGFRVDNTKQGKFTGVYNYNAHAWTEVYFPNIGWLTFDSVSPSDFARNEDEATRHPASTKRPETSEDPGTPSPTPSPTPSEEPIESETAGDTPAGSYVPLPSGATSTPIKERGEFKDIIYLIILILALIAFAVTAGIIISKKKKKVRPLTYREKIVDKFMQNVNILTELGCPLESGDTISGYFEKAKKHIQKDVANLITYITPQSIAKVDMDKVSGLYEKAVYSDYELTEDEMAYLDLFKSNLKHYEEAYKIYLRSKNKN